jgi:twitching motility protein PilT
MDIIGATRVKDLELSDLYLGLPTVESKFSTAPGSAVSAIPRHPALHEDLDRLFALCNETLAKAPGCPAFKVRHDAVTYRGVAIPTGTGTVFLLRRLADAVRSLAEIGIPPAYARRMSAKYLSGLFIVCGASRSGRTTTACAMLKERLLSYGGLGITGEDPIELPLEGSHANGVCYQTALSRDPHRFGSAFSSLLRCGADTILIDEVCTPEAAAAVLQASTGGQLVIVTMQAENVVQCLIRLHAMASEKLVPDNARALLAEGLAGVLHQQMSLVVKSKIKLESELLFPGDAPTPRTLLRKGEYEQLGAVMRQQMATIIAENTALRVGAA